MGADEFLLEEYKLRVQEMCSLMAEARRLELYCAGAVAGLLSWFATMNLANALAWFIPLLIPLLGLLRSWAVYERVRQTAEYVRVVERHILGSTEQPQGWETHYAGIAIHGLTPTGLVFWCALTLTCLAGPFVLSSFTI